MAEYPGISGQQVTALVIDAVVCALILAAGVLIAGEVARARGAREITAVIDHLQWRHLALVLVVLAAYWIGMRWLAGRTPGQALAAKLTGRTPQRATAVRRPIGPGLGPTVVALALAATVLGTTIPIDAADNAGGGGGFAPVTPTTEAPVSTASPGEAPGTGGENTGGQQADARDQAVAIDNLLTASTRSRASLNAAIGQVDSCRNLSGAIGTFLRVGDERSEQLARARALRVDLLPDGGQIRDNLVAALSYSLDADRAFTAWARNAAANGCGHDGNYAEGRAASDSAQAAKKAFLELWNPVAPQFGLPPRSRTQI